MLKRIGGVIGLITAVQFAAGCQQGFKAEESFEQTVAWAPFERVEVRTRNGAIELTQAADAGEVVISGKKFARGATQADAEAALDEISVSAGASPTDATTLVVAVEMPTALIQRSGGASLKIRVPAAVSAKLATSNGAVRAARMRGPVEVDTSNGVVELSEIDGSVEVATSNGAIELTAIGGTVSAETTNGALKFRDVRGAVTAETSNGSVDVAVAPPTGAAVDVETSNGAVMVHLPSDCAADLSLSTSNGRVTADVSGGGKLDVAKKKNDQLTGKLNGGGAPVNVRTSNGPITLRAS